MKDEQRAAAKKALDSAYALLLEEIETSECDHAMLKIGIGMLHMVELLAEDEPHAKIAPSARPDRITLSEWELVLSALKEWATKQYDNRISWDASGNHRTDGLGIRDSYEIEFPPAMRTEFVRDALQWFQGHIYRDETPPPTSRTVHVLEKFAPVDDKEHKDD